jgi:glyoxylase-like metal-dependent hydrolase (beta-lactamase superfamily II)
MEIITMPVGMLGTNCYIVKSDAGKCAVIDPGAQPEKIIDLMVKNKLTLQYVLLTHGHHDHIGGVKKLITQYRDARLYIGKGDLEMLGDSQKSLAIFKTASDSDFIIGNADTLAEGDTIELDELTFTVLETPGHTKGGVTYLCGDAMFSGDTLFREDVGRTDLYGGDYPTLKRSLAKLDALKGDFVVYPGHGESSTLDYERQNNQYIGGEPGV